ncbi:hypothetical protein O181_034034 [Austropuccinia psidii MF-1]|uniref:Uncharacterized protein n=1 Tax=Austropuccinia psidii MF-1 TaxID=1389203 RepID=A0A9Q3H945_9BASI|nr:hypothetical protein [Austropuccinia psidii MF-1]
MQEWTPIPQINETRSPLDVHFQLTNGSVNRLKSSTQFKRLCMPILHHFSVSHSPMPDPHHETMILPKNLLNGHGCTMSPLISSSGSDSSLHANRSQDYSRPQVLMSPSPQIPFNLCYVGGSIVTTENSGTKAWTGEKAKKKKEKKSEKGIQDPNAKATLILTQNSPFKIMPIFAPTSRIKTIMISFLESVQKQVLVIERSHFHVHMITYKKKYMMTRQWANNTVSGLSEFELGMKRQEKLESMCPCYTRMDHVLGSKANISAFSEMDTTKEGEVIELTHSDSKSDVEDSSNSKSGLYSYEKSQ